MSFLVFLSSFSYWRGSRGAKGEVGVGVRVVVWEVGARVS